MSKHGLLTLVLCMVSYVDSFAQWSANPDLADLLSVGLPVVDIHTTGGEEPTYTPVSPPEGAFGRGILAEKVTGQMVVLQGADTLYDSGTYVSDTAGITIRVRGNTSAYQAIKPYKIKLQHKANLLFRGNDSIYRDKHWVLIDGNKLNAIVGLKLSELMGMAWTPQYRPVNVRLNGQYRGLYLLLESVRRNPRCRVDVDKQTGYLIEQDAYWWKEDYYFRTQQDHYYTLKYPDVDDATELQKEYISQIAERMEASISDGTYPRYIDIDSFARWLLAHDILGSYDAAGSNIFFAKYDDTEETLFTMPLLWDFDAIAHYPARWAAIHQGNYGFFSSLLDNSNPAFLRTYVALWEELAPDIFDEMDRFLLRLSESDLLGQLQTSRELVMQLLDYTDSTWAEDVEDYRQWFRGRNPWLKDAIYGLQQSTAIGHMQSETSGVHLYDLAGRRLLRPGRGVYIRGGRKYVKCPL